MKRIISLTLVASVATFPMVALSSASAAVSQETTTEIEQMTLNQRTCQKDRRPYTCP